MKRVREVKDLSATRLRDGDAVLAVIRGSTKEPMVVFSNLGYAYVLRHQRRAGVDRLRRAGAEAVQLPRRRARRRRAADERCRRRPRARWRGGQQARLRHARLAGAAPRDVDARRPPLREAADGDEIVGVARVLERRTSCAWLPATRAR
jgi:hypothetical protein